MYTRHQRGVHLHPPYPPESATEIHRQIDRHSTASRSVIIHRNGKALSKQLNAAPHLRGVHEPQVPTLPRKETVPVGPVNVRALMERSLHTLFRVMYGGGLRTRLTIFPPRAAKYSLGTRLDRRIAAKPRDCESQNCLRILLPCLCLNTRLQS